MRAWIRVGVGCLVLVVAACAHGAEPGAEIDPQPTVSGVPAERADMSGYKAPDVLKNSVFVEPGWMTVPEVLDGVAVGHRESDDGTLEFSAVDSAGTVLWSARRPLACTGFVLTRADGRPLAVLTNSVPGEETVTVTTVTAYDLHTGEEAWGPVPVPGAHVGPGLVYAEVPAASMGQLGPRTTLDNATGNIVRVESEPSGSIVGEYDGVILVSDDTELMAEDQSGDRRLWRLPLDELDVGPGEVGAAADTEVGEGFALVGTPAAGYSLIEVTTGSVVSTGVSDAVRDPDSPSIVVVVGDELRMMSPDGELGWAQKTESSTRLEGVGSGVVFTRSGQTIRAHDLATGTPVRQYEASAEGRAVVPVRFTATGAVVQAGPRVLMAVASD